MFHSIYQSVFLRYDLRWTKRSHSSLNFGVEHGSSGWVSKWLIWECCRFGAKISLEYLRIYTTPNTFFSIVLNVYRWPIWWLLNIRGIHWRWNDTRFWTLIARDFTWKPGVGTSILIQDVMEANMCNISCKVVHQFVTKVGHPYWRVHIWTTNPSLTQRSRIWAPHRTITQLSHVLNPVFMLSKGPLERLLRKKNCGARKPA